MDRFWISWRSVIDSSSHESFDQEVVSHFLTSVARQVGNREEVISAGAMIVGNRITFTCVVDAPDGSQATREAQNAFNSVLVVKDEDGSDAELTGWVASFLHCAEVSYRPLETA